MVLLVDDSPVALRALARRLAAEDFDVREGPTAALAVEADVTDLACAVVDIELADGNGADIAAVLRAKRATLPIAFFTAGASPPVLARAHAYGPIFMKPNIDAVVAWAKHVSTAQPPPTK
jgi:ActR/RegA family two-component response regulator